MTDVHIVLIGGGPRALVTLNALYHALRNVAVSDQISIIVIDPHEGGIGCHDPNQPDYLFTNTLASQVTAFYPLTSEVEDAGWITGPSFIEWANRSEVRNDDKRCFHSDESQLVSKLSYLPRSLLGQYLRWAFQMIVARFPNSIKFCQRYAVALFVKRTANGFCIGLDDNTEQAADYIFMSTGHSTNCLSTTNKNLRNFAIRRLTKNPYIAFFTRCYPTSALKAISSEATVAIQGLGLTAWDAIAELTEGRGGKYITNKNGHLVYLSSGDEPKILLYSRNCLPSTARGINQKGLTRQHPARFFTPQALTNLRAEKKRTTGSAQLDFKLEVLPLLKCEMAFAYRMVATGLSIDSEVFIPTHAEMAAIDVALDPFMNQHFESFTDYRTAFWEYIREDLAEADKGNLSAPIKAATDVIRDCRATICMAVDFRGLTPDSERWFRTTFIPIMNRVAFGPPKFRNHQLLAMFEAGIIDLATGPNSVLSTDEASGKFVLTSEFNNHKNQTLIDVLIIARLDSFLPEIDENPLTLSLLSEGLVRPYRNGDSAPGGLDINRDHQPIDRNGRPTPNL